MISLLMVANLFLCAASVGSAESAKYPIYVDGARIASAGYNHEGSILVPFRSLLSTFGFAVQYDAQKKTINATTDGRTIRMTNGSKQAYVNGKAMTMPVAPIALQGTTYIPLRFVSETMDYRVDFEATAQTIRIERPSRSAHVPNDETPTERIATLSSASVVTVIAGDREGNGIVVGERLVLTTHSLVESRLSGKIVLADGSERVIEGVAAFAPASNLVLLRVSEGTALPNDLQIGDPSTMRIGASVVAISRTGDYYAEKGIVDSLSSRKDIDYIGYQITTKPVEGGALFNANGQLVGIIAPAKELGITSPYTAISIAEAAELLESVAGKAPEAISMSPLDSIAAKKQTAQGEMMTNQEAAAFTLWFLERGVRSIPISLSNAFSGLAIGRWTAEHQDNGGILIRCQMPPNAYLNYVTNFSQIKPHVERWAKQYLGQNHMNNFPNHDLSFVIELNEEIPKLPDTLSPEVTATGLEPGKPAPPHSLIEVTFTNGIEISVRP